MKKYRRIEITAFKRRVWVGPGWHPETDELDVSVNDAESNELIDTDTKEGQAILLEAVRCLEERIAESTTDDRSESGPSAVVSINEVKR